MYSDLTNEQIEKHINGCAMVGVKSALQEIKDGTVDTQNNLFKVNLPSSIEKFESGNGEGIWACSYNQESADIYASGTLNKEFEVVVLNDAICYPFPWGCVITVVMVNNPNNRPVLSKRWITEVIKESTKGEKTLEMILGE